ncbi:MAG: hypothetical protein R3A10_15480 [Caldilineaceae bacterium]
MLRTARIATWTAFLASLVIGGVVFAFGALVSPDRLGEFGFSIRLGALRWSCSGWSPSSACWSSSSAATTWTAIRAGVFIGRLCLTIAAVILLVLAGNLGQLVGAWIGTSCALHRLLVFYADRPGGARGAQKFLVARTSDISLIIAAILLFRAFGTADLGALAQAAAGSGMPASSRVRAGLPCSSSWRRCSSRPCSPSTAGCLR